MMIPLGAASQHWIGLYSVKTRLGASRKSRTSLQAGASYAHGDRFRKPNAGQSALSRGPCAITVASSPPT